MIEKILGDYKDFARSLLAEVHNRKLKLSQIEIDHLCYRVESYESYELKKDQLSQIGQLLSEEIVNGRPICTFKLNQPMIFDGISVPLVELPAPKAGTKYKEGFEHFEMVVAKNLNEFISENPHIEFNLHNKDSEINPDVSLKLQKGIVKFHPFSLEAVIAQEMKEKGSFIANNKSTIVFDLDDTLVATATVFRNNMRQALSAYFGREIEDSKMDEILAPSFIDIFEKVQINDANARAKVLQLFGELWPEKTDEQLVYPGIRTLLSILKSYGFNLVVWSARDRQSVLKTLQSTRLQGWFSEVFTFDEGSGGKPHDFKRLSHLKVHSLIGDSSTDMLGAEKLKCQFFQSQWRKNPKEISHQGPSLEKVESFYLHWKNFV